ncbi:patatin-like phospholipase family protein [Azonexus sp.]|uniref:patatin-like phospholipase family protein n=1 Tax=Azonexus sp. TaxID=1872668 RepID=UPI0035B43307
MTRRLLRCLLFALSLFAGLAQAAERPRVGLVLGGGGARGAAHLGILEALEEQRIPVDCVAGTSMGALFAGAWAAGVTPAAMRRELERVDWRDIFIDNPEYGEMGYRNRLIARIYPPGSEGGVGDKGVRYQGGVVAGQKIKLFLNRLVGTARRIESLPLPLSIVATDIGNGERVVFRDGTLSTAMRASMSVPGLLAPTELGGRKLVDGGLVDNLPIAEVRERCQADVVIAVDVGTPLLKSEEIGSLLTVSAQMIGILTQQNVERSLALLGPRDILIRPDLGDLTAVDFPRHAEAAERGRLAAQAVAERLAALRLSPADYAAWQSSMTVEAPPQLRVDAVEIAGLRRVNPQAVERLLDIAPGETVDALRIDYNLLRVYGDGHYESVDYTLGNEAGRNLLRVMPVEKSWGPDYLRFGITLQADDGDGASFGLRGAYHRTWLNALGGELLYHAELGTHNRLGVNYYQPLDARQRVFFEVLAGVDQERIGIYQDERRLAEYKASEGRLGVWLGHSLGVYGSARLGWLHRDRHYRLDTGLPLLPNFDTDFGGWQGSIDLDRFDRMHFPTRGWAARVAYFNSPKLDYARVDVDLRGAFSVADNVFNARFAYTGSPRGRLPGFDAARLGGFLNMTAFSRDQLQGDSVRYFGLRSEHIVSRMPLGLRGDLRLGLALEAANLGGELSQTRRRHWIDSTALYLGGETPLGPAYLGIGRSSTGASSIFLFVGSP